MLAAAAPKATKGKVPAEAGFPPEGGPNSSGPAACEVVGDWEKSLRGSAIRVGGATVSTLLAVLLSLF